MAGALKRGLLALAMVLTLALPLGLTLGLTACGKGPGPAARPSASAPRNGASLQEVAPPAAVLQLKEVLDHHQPRVAITAPAGGTLLPPDAWTLEVSVRDWPLVDAGSQGLGPHLVVQIDNQDPIRTTAATPAPGDRDLQTVRLALDPLAPGSHRITAYAAWPWGEALKAPAASDQITVHRVVATPLTQPRSGEPQLLPVSPPTVAGVEPVLIDWLLRDAPLQHLRDDDTRWRLRITINGDSLQVDRQQPLWLKGFRPGSNAVVMELLDGLGEPIAPTLNTLVREVVLKPGSRPIWAGRALTPADLAVLTGEAPPPPPPAPAPSASKAAAATAPPEAGDARPTEQVPVPENTDIPPVVPAPAPGSPEAGQPAAPEPAIASTPPPPAATPSAEDATPTEALPTEDVATEDTPSEDTPLSEPPPPAPEPPTPEPPAPPTMAPAPTPAAQEANQPERPRPTLPSARSELNPDGSVIRPKPQGPLARLRGGGS